MEKYMHGNNDKRFCQPFHEGECVQFGMQLTYVESVTFDNEGGMQVTFLAPDRWKRHLEHKKANATITDSKEFPPMCGTE